jgi:DHA3 family multidrug efflux protein-like MFS transporter
LWTIAIFFAVQSWIALLTAGMFAYLCLMPVVEAAEQTILQTVVPLERQGRVFGFAQSVEQAAAPLTAFLAGPIAELVFIPLMTTGAGPALIGSWYGAGPERGLALLFSTAGAIGLLVTLAAMRTRAFRTLSTHYAQR